MFEKHCEPWVLCSQLTSSFLQYIPKSVFIEYEKLKYKDTKKQNKTIPPP